MDYLEAEPVMQPLVDSMMALLVRTSCHPHHDESLVSDSIPHVLQQ